MHSKIRIYRLKNGGKNKENREYTDFIETWLKMGWLCRRNNI